MKSQLAPAKESVGAWAGDFNVQRSSQAPRKVRRRLRTDESF